MPAYRRVLIKLSGEALQGDGTHGIEAAMVTRVTAELTEVVQSGAQVALVVGGGNIFRGLSGTQAGMASRVRADQMGMLATLLNALALQDGFERAGQPAEVMSGLPVAGVVEAMNARKARALLEQGTVMIFAGGTGSPFFTTDTAAALRAAEVGADALLKATQVDGIYDADPRKVPTAKRFDRVSFDECIARDLRVMDQTAFSLCREAKIPLVVFDLHQPGNLKRVVAGEPLGTVVHL